jgi:hypothetical protein
MQYVVGESVSDEAKLGGARACCSCADTNVVRDQLTVRACAPQPFETQRATAASSALRTWIELDVQARWHSERGVLLLVGRPSIHLAQM